MWTVNTDILGSVNCNMRAVIAGHQKQPLSQPWKAAVSCYEVTISLFPICSVGMIKVEVTSLCAEPGSSPLWLGQILSWKQHHYRVRCTRSGCLKWCGLGKEQLSRSTYLARQPVGYPGVHRKGPASLSSGIVFYKLSACFKDCTALLVPIHGSHDPQGVWASVKQLLGRELFVRWNSVSVKRQGHATEDTVYRKSRNMGPVQHFQMPSRTRVRSQSCVLLRLKLPGRG